MVAARNSGGNAAVWDINKNSMGATSSSADPVTTFLPESSALALSWLPAHPHSLAIGTNQKQFRIFDVRGKKAAFSVQTGLSSPSVGGVQFDPFCDNRVATYSEEGIVQLWDLRIFVHAALTLHSSGSSTKAGAPVIDLQWCPNRRDLLSTISEGEEVARMWDLSGNLCVGDPSTSSAQGNVGSNNKPIAPVDASVASPPSNTYFPMGGGTRWKKVDAGQPMVAMSWHPCMQHNFAGISSTGTVSLGIYNENAPCAWSSQGDVVFSIDGGMITAEPEGEDMHSAATREEIAEPDISNLMRNRAELGYGLEIKENLSICVQTHHTDLVRLWAWMEHLLSLVRGPTLSAGVSAAAAPSTSASAVVGATQLLEGVASLFPKTVAPAPAPTGPNNNSSTGAGADGPEVSVLVESKAVEWFAGRQYTSTARRTAIKSCGWWSMVNPRTAVLADTKAGLKELQAASMGSNSNSKKDMAPDASKSSGGLKPTGVIDAVMRKLTRQAAKDDGADDDSMQGYSYVTLNTQQALEGDGVQPVSDNPLDSIMDDMRLRLANSNVKGGKAASGTTVNSAADEAAIKAGAALLFAEQVNFENSINNMEREGKHEQAAAVCIFHLQLSRAVACLSHGASVALLRSQETAGDFKGSHMGFAALALQAFALAACNPNASTTNGGIVGSELDMVQALQGVDPYLRAAFVFLSTRGRSASVAPSSSSASSSASPPTVSDKAVSSSTLSETNFDGVLKEQAIPLRERVAFACMYLSDSELTQYIHTNYHQKVTAGTLDALVLTGLGPASLKVFSAYLDRTADIQTVAILACYSMAGVPQETPQLQKLSQYVEVYRQLLNAYGQWSVRAQFDIAKALLLRTSTVAVSSATSALLKARPPAQIYVRCNHCGTALAGDQMQPQSKFKSTFKVRSLASKKQAPPTDAPPATEAAASSPKAETTSDTSFRIRSCPSCKKALPRCALCLTNLDCAATPSTHNVSTGIDVSSPFDFTNWITWCQQCRHGGHASHLKTWFETQSTCPVSDCNCRCVNNDIFPAFPPAGEDHHHHM